MRYRHLIGLSYDLAPSRKSGGPIVTSFLVRLRAVPLVLAVGAGGARAQIPPRLTATPAQTLDGDSLSIRATGLTPGARVTIHLQSTGVRDDGAPEPYYSSATYVADPQGTVDLAQSAPVDGDYTGADLHGLFWSQHSLTADSAGLRAIAVLRLDAPRSIPPGQNVLTLEAGEAVLARTVITIAPGDPAVVRDTVRADSLVGVFYHRAGSGKLPTIIALGGSEGGTDVGDWLGPRLASRGFVVLGINYFSPPESPVRGVSTALIGIPVELIGRARAWLASRADVDTSQIGIVGYSKGAELALLSAATYQWIRAVVAYAPPDYVWQGIRRGPGPAASSWTRGGRDVPFLPTTGAREEIARGRQSGGKIYLARVARHNLAAASPEALRAAAIPIERGAAPILLIGGGSDELWDSGASVERLETRLDQARYSYPHQALVYPGAGHVLLGSGWHPTTADNSDAMQNGGTAEADGRAQADAWPRVIAFLQRALHPH